MISEKDTSLLEKLRSYLEEHNRASLGHLSLHFRVPPEQIRDLLDIWLKKGMITYYPGISTGTCGDPHGASDNLIFEWIDDNGE